MKQNETTSLLIHRGERRSAKLLNFHWLKIKQLKIISIFRIRNQMRVTFCKYETKYNLSRLLWIYAPSYIAGILWALNLFFTCAVINTATTPSIYSHSSQPMWYIWAQNKYNAMIMGKKEFDKVKCFRFWNGGVIVAWFHKRRSLLDLTRKKCIRNSICRWFSQLAAAINHNTTRIFANMVCSVFAIIQYIW